MDLHFTGTGFETLWTLSTKLLTDYHHNNIIKLRILGVCGRLGRISRSGLTQDIKMGSYVFQCAIFTPMDSTLCLFTVTGEVSCPVSAVWHSNVATHWSKYHCFKQTLLQYDLTLKPYLTPTNKQTFMM